MRRIRPDWPFTGTGLPMLPGIEATPINLQDAIHAGQPKLPVTHMHDPVLHRDSWVKYVATFYRFTHLYEKPHLNAPPRRAGMKDAYCLR